MPWPWVKMGTGKFREGWLSDVFTGNMFEIDVTVHSHKSKEGIYMVEEMLGWPYMTEFFGATQRSFRSSSATLRPISSSIAAMRLK